MKRFTEKKCNQGIALPVTIVIVVVLLTLAVAIIMQATSTKHMQGGGEKQKAQENTGEIVGGLMQDIFSSGRAPDPAKLAQIGLNAAPPSPGGAVVPFKGKMGEIAFSGSFNGGDGPWSTYQPVPDKVDPKKDNFFRGKIACYDPKKFPVPPQHSLIFVKTEMPREAPRYYYYMFSNMAPYGALAPRGSIRLKEATFITNPWLNPAKQDVSGHKVYLGAGKRIEVQGKVNGKAISGRPASEKPVVIKNTESTEITEDEQEELEKLLAQMESQMNKSMDLLAEELKKRAIDEGILGLGEAMGTAMGDFSLGFFKGPRVNCGGFSFDPLHKKMIWNKAFFLKKGKTFSVPLNLEIKGDLILQDKALLATTGSLTVHGRLFLGQGSVVYADNDLKVDGRVNVHYSPKVDPREIDPDIDPEDIPEELQPFLPYLGIESAIIAKKNVELGEGVRHLKFKPQRKACDFPFTGAGNPFKKDNPLFDQFNDAVNQVLNPLNALAARFAPYLSENIEVSPGDEDTETPGIAICSLKDGAVKVVDHGPDASLAGLIVCRQDIVLEFPPDGSGVFSGVLMTSDGDISAFETTLRYYPYFTHGTIPIDPDESRFVQFSIPHIISSGEYKK